MVSSKFISDRKERLHGSPPKLKPITIQSIKKRSNQKKRRVRATNPTTTTTAQEFLKSSFPESKIVPVHSEDEDDDSNWGLSREFDGTPKEPMDLSLDGATFRRALKKNKLREFNVSTEYDDLTELISRADNCYVRAWLWFAFPEWQTVITQKMGYNIMFNRYVQAIKISVTHVLAVTLAFIVQVAFPGLMLQQEYERDCESVYDLSTDTSSFGTADIIRHYIKSYLFRHPVLIGSPTTNSSLNSAVQVVASSLAPGSGSWENINTNIDTVHYKIAGCEDLCTGQGDLNTRCFAVLLSLYAFGEMFETVRECQVMMRLHSNTKASHFARLILVLGCWAQLVSFGFLLLCTSALFLRESEYKDLLLNAVALTFVLEIDNKIEVQGRELLTAIERKLVMKPTVKSQDCSLVCVIKFLVRLLLQVLSAPLTLLAELLQSVVVTVLVGALIFLMILGSSFYIAICI